MPSTQEASGEPPAPARRIARNSTAPPASTTADQAKSAPAGPKSRSASGVASAAPGSSTAQASHGQGEERKGRLAARKRSRTGSRSSSPVREGEKRGSYSEASVSSPAGAGPR